MAIKYDQNVWFSSRFAIYNFWVIRDKVGESAKTSIKFQKEREAWILGVVLLGIKKLKGQLWWLKIPEVDPPDLEAMSVLPDSGKDRNVQFHREIEVMEITDKSKGTIIESIASKLKNKYYIKETGLVVYLRKTMFIPDMQLLAMDISKLKPRVADIWLVGNTKLDTNDFIIFSILPEVEIIRFNLDDEIRQLPKGDRIEMIFGKGTKTTLTSAPITKFNPKGIMQLQEN